MTRFVGRTTSASVTSTNCCRYSAIGPVTWRVRTSRHHGSTAPSVRPLQRPADSPARTAGPVERGHLKGRFGSAVVGTSKRGGEMALTHGAPCRTPTIGSTPQHGPEDLRSLCVSSSAETSWEAVDRTSAAFCSQRWRISSNSLDGRLGHGPSGPNLCDSRPFSDRIRLETQYLRDCHIRYPH